MCRPRVHFYKICHWVYRPSVCLLACLPACLSVCLSVRLSGWLLSSLRLVTGFQVLSRQTVPARDALDGETNTAFYRTNKQGLNRSLYEAFTRLTPGRTQSVEACVKPKINFSVQPNGAKRLRITTTSPEKKRTESGKTSRGHRTQYSEVSPTTQPLCPRVPHFETTREAAPQHPPGKV